MNPNHPIENKIKEALDARKISPSPQAWDRLDAMLTLQEKPKKKPWIVYFSIAASFIGLMMILSINHENSSPLENPLPIENATVNQDIPENTQTPNLIDSVFLNKSAVVQTESKNQKINHSQPKKNEKTIEIIPKTDANLEPKPALSSDKRKRALALLASLENDSVGQKSAQTWDSNKQERMVDSQELLKNTQAEMDHTFREKTVKKVNKNLNSLKSSWVNRNLE